jgi:site-specific DNA-methyltransferase (adenine-specific)
MIDLIQGDCLEKMREIPDGTVDLTVTSPPYDNLRTYNGNNAQWGEHVWKAVIQDLFRVTKEGCVVVWVVGDATIKGSETGTSFKQALWAMECGFNLHDTMIWNKGMFTSPCPTRYGAVFEYMFIWTKGKPSYVSLIKDRKSKKGGKVIYGKKRNADGTMKWTSTHGTIQAEYGQRFNVWDVPPCVSNTERTKHPAQFSEKLAHDHLISWSNEGDTVLDPFMGSGTTGKMAKQLGRDFIGIELDPVYYEIARKRIGEV